MRFQLIKYTDLGARAQENHNFQKVAAVLADYGFSTIKLSDDWRGADFLALRFDGSVLLKVQLKGRFEVAKKYVGKEIWICFPYDDGIYLFPHDEVLNTLMKEKPKMFLSRSWSPANGHYNQRQPDKTLRRLLKEHYYRPI